MNNENKQTNVAVSIRYKNAVAVTWIISAIQSKYIKRGFPCTTGKILK